MTGSDYIIIGLFATFILLFILTWLPTLIKVKSAGGNISIGTILGTKARKLSIKPISNSLVRAAKAGVKLSAKELQACYLLTGRVDSITDAAIAAKDYDVPLMLLCQLSLTGADPREFAEYLKTKEISLDADIKEISKEYIRSLDKEELAINRMA